MIEVRKGGAHVLWVTTEAQSPNSVSPRDGEGSNADVAQQASGESATYLLQDSDESTETFILRTAEHMRGRLLPGERAQIREASSPEQTFQHRASLNVMPAFTYSTYGGSGAALVTDGALHWGRLGVGPYVLFSLHRTAWTGKPPEFSQRQVTVGVQGRYLIFAAANWQLQALAGLGGRATAFREEGPPADAVTFRGTGYALVANADFESAYLPLPWLGLGLRVGQHVGFVTHFPKDKTGLEGGKAKAFEKAWKTSSVDGMFVTGVFASVRF